MDGVTLVCVTGMVSLVGAVTLSGTVTACASIGTLTSRTSTLGHMTVSATLPPALKTHMVTVPDLGGAVLGFTMVVPSPLSV